VVQEATHGPWITMPEVSAGSSVFQEEVGDALVRVGEDQAPLSEPSIESVQGP
jgi:hypothetical protein